MKINNIVLLTSQVSNNPSANNKIYDAIFCSNPLSNNPNLNTILKAYNFNISFTASQNIGIDDKTKKQQISCFLNNHPDLAIDDACACLGLNLSENEVSKYKELKRNYPGLSLIELAIITKYALSDSDVTRYIQNSTEIDSDGNKKFDIPNEEMLLCIKEGFDDTQLSRYAELRNRTINLKEKSVRKTGGTQKLPITYVLNAVKESKSDGDIRDEENLYELINTYGIRNGIELFAAKVDTSYIDKILKMGFAIDDAINSYSLKNEERLIYLNKIRNGCDRTEAFDYAQLSGEDRALYNSVRKKLTHYGAIMYVYMPDELKSEYIKFIEQGYSVDEAYSYVFLKSKYRKKYLKGLEIGLPPLVANDYAGMSILQRLRINHRIKKSGIPDDFEKKYYYNIRISAHSELYDEEKKLGLSDDEFDYYVILESNEQREKYVKLLKQVDNCCLACLLALQNVSTITPEALEQIPENIWYIMQTGTNKQTHDIFKKAIQLMLEFSQNPPELKEVKKEEINDVLPSDYVYNGFDLNKSDNSLSVKLQKLPVLDKPVLVAKDNNSDNSYIAMNGAVAVVKPPYELNSEKTDNTLGSHCNLSKEKQLPILKRAIKEFVFDVTDEDGDCIISKGIENVADSIVSSDKTKDETKNYFIKAFNKLKQDNKFNAQNILMLFPKDAILSVNPYTTTGNNMLYSVSAEWKSKDGTKWEIRIHSTDLSPKGIQSENWIVRLGYEDSNAPANRQKRFYLRHDNTNNSFDFNGTPNSAESHIEITSPIETGNLLNNIDFQNIIRAISTKLYQTKKVDNICMKYSLPVRISPRNTTEKITAVIKDAIENPIHYFEHKEDIDGFRASFGYLNLDRLQV